MEYIINILSILNFFVYVAVLICQVMIWRAEKERIKYNIEYSKSFKELEKVLDQHMMHHHFNNTNKEEHESIH